MEPRGRLALLALAALALIVVMRPHRGLPPEESWLEPGFTAARPEPAPPEPLHEATEKGPVRRGVARFGGRPLAETTSAEPLFWLRHEATNDAPKPDARWFPETSRFELRGLAPGEHFLSIRANSEPRNSQVYPGDMGGGRSLKDSDPDADVDLTEVMHVTAPFDNAHALARHHRDPQPAHASPIHVRWEPLRWLSPAGVSYGWSIDQVQAEPWRSSTMKGGSVHVTEVAIELPPSRPGHYYLLRLWAMRDTLRVGGLRLHGQDYLAWDYRFVVPAADAPD